MSRSFASVPSVRFARSKIPMPHGVKTSMSTGYLYPVEWREVLPGDTFKVNASVAARVSTAFLRPVLDNLVMDVYHFFVPLRLVDKDVAEVFGKPSPSQYEADGLDDFPVTADSMTVTEKTVYDYIGVRPGTVPAGINVLPARAFALIWNEWFRNENVVDETYIQKTKVVTSDDYANNYSWSPNNYTGKLPRVSRKKDYFSSCFPKPQKGDSVSLPLLGTIPVRGNGKVLGLDVSANDGTSNLRVGAGAVLGQPVQAGSMYLSPSYAAYGKTLDFAEYARATSVLSNRGVGLVQNAANSGVVADMVGVGVNVNDLRFAVQLQRMLERDAIYGSRYNEYILGHYGVSSPDSRLQFSEYLGGGRFPISLQEVPQTSAPSEDNPLGAVAASSLSNGKSFYTKGFTEHGYVFTVACIRQLQHTYQQGIPRGFLKKNRNDVYDPLFDTLSYQPVYRSELFIDETETDLKEHVFGYNEAFADYRFCPSRITGEMRSGATNSFDVWHFGDVYENAPVLNDEFISEPASFVDRSLAAPSSEVDQFLVDFWFDETDIRVMSAYSMPGLVDHH